MAGYYLLDHPNRHGPHYYTTRRGRLLAIVVHITAGLEDFDATDDHSAENTARYAATTDRAVSWHSGSDSDTAFDLLPASYTAFQCRGYNSTTYGHEISKADPDWRDAPEPWRTRTLRLAGRHLGAKARALGVPIRKATKAELDRAIATGGAPVGFIGHAELDPERRLDPGRVSGVGDTFPWMTFLAIARGEEEDPLAVVNNQDEFVQLVQRAIKREFRSPENARQTTRQAILELSTRGGVAALRQEAGTPYSVLRQEFRELARLGAEDTELDEKLDEVLDELLAARAAELVEPEPEPLAIDEPDPA